MSTRLFCGFLLGMGVWTFAWLWSLASAVGL